jgi:tape measure domain-containing protein
MAIDIERLVLQVEAKIDKLEKANLRAVQGTSKSLKQIEDRFDQMNVRVSRSGEQMGLNLKNAIAAIGIGLAIKETTSYADAWTSARNKIAAAGVANSQLGGTMDDLVGLARETRSEFGAVADLYARVARNGQQLGLSQEQILKLTGNVTKALVAGGAAASEQASTITQLGQALGSGRLGGDELRGILENAPLLAKAIADEFGVAVGQLKQLGSEGALTSDRVAQAILKADTIQAQFAKTTTTVAGAFTNLRTSFTQYIGKSQEAGAATQALSGFVNLVANDFDKFADAAVAAAVVMGGAVAAGGVAKLGAALLEMVTAARTAATTVAALRVAMTFFTGPVGAAVLGFAAALTAFGLSSIKAQNSVDGLSKKIDALASVNAKIKSDTEALAGANDTLRRAIETQGPAAQDVARQEIDAIQRRIAANKKLAGEYRSQILSQLNESEKLLHTKDKEGRTVDDKRLILSNIFDARGITQDQFLAQVDEKLRKGPLNKADQQVLDMITSVDEALGKIDDLRKRFRELSNPTGVPGAGAEDSANIRATAAATGQYVTDLEKLQAAILKVRDAREADQQAISRANMARDEFLAQADQGQIPLDADGNPKDAARMGALDRSVSGAFAAASANEAAGSRIAMQALLDYARATKDVAAAMAQLPSLEDVLTGGDAASLRTELGKMASDAVDAIAVGADKIEVEFRETLAAINKAQKDFIATGGTDLSRFDAARDAAYKKRSDDLQELANKAAVKSPFAGLLDDLKDDPKNLPVFEVYGQALRDATKDGLARGLKEGIETGNWGRSLRDVLADSLTQALDKSLDQLADVLADLFLGNGNKNSGLINAAVGFFTSGQNRASGGPRSAFSVGKVNETGQGEFLFMGNNPGQVLTAAQVNAKVAGGARGGVNIDNRLYVQGSIDAVTWPKVQQAMAENNQHLMQVMPSMIDGRTIDNARYRRYGGRR